MSSPSDPHAGQPVRRLGPAPREARLAVILLHGRGASASDILGLARELALDDVCFLAPEAAGHTWYPLSFLAPTAQNEPGLSSALGVIAGLGASLDADGLSSERVALMGFSQGACLSLEFAARNPARYRAVVGLSGGVIGPPGAARQDTGSLDGTPVFLGCSDVDAHIPVTRVHETAALFRVLGAVVDERIYPGFGHAVNADELSAVRALLG